MKRLIPLLCCLFAAGLLVAGCGEDDPKPVPDTDTTDTTDTDVTPDADVTPDTDVTPDQDVTPDEDVQPDQDIVPDNDVQPDEIPDEVPDETDEDVCCTDGECLAQGKICNETTCLCEDPPAGECLRVNDVCDPSVAQPVGFVCEDDGAGAGVCLQACKTVNGEDPCPTGSLCFEKVEGEGGSCAPSECIHFFQNDCGDGEKCFPLGNGANFCIPNGMAVEGADCESDLDCAAGLICMGQCEAPDCSPLTDVQNCPNGQMCGGLTYGGEPIDIGFCFQSCDPFGANTCGTGEQCFPIERDPNTGKFYGQCEAMPSGTVADGDTCNPQGTTAAELCLPGSFCVPYSDGPMCQKFCDPEATTGAGSCGDGSLCNELQYSDGRSTGWGVCFEGCDPWAEISGCDTGTWCAPDDERRGVGQCYQSNPTGNLEGEQCSQALGYCADHLMCIGVGDGISECFTMCDIAATGTEPGQCEPKNGQYRACSPLSYEENGEEITLAWGICDDACIYNRADHFNPTQPCPSGQVCQPGFLFGVDFDLCTEYAPELIGAPLDVWEDCPEELAGYFCRPGGFCMYVSDTEVQCVEVCDARVHPGYGVPPHPDCTTGVQCSDLFRIPEEPYFGLCFN